MDANQPEPVKNDAELSEEQLEQVAGGQGDPYAELFRAAAGSSASPLTPGSGPMGVDIDAATPNGSAVIVL